MIYIYLNSAQVNGKCRPDGLRALFAQHFPGIPGTYPSRRTHDYAHGAPGSEIPAAVTRRRPFAGGKTNGGKPKHNTEVGPLHAKTREKRSAAQKLWAAPQKLHRAVQMLYPAPQKLYPAPQKLYPAPQMLHRAVQMLCPAPRKLYRAVQMLYPAPRKLYFAVQMCFIAVQMCIDAAQMFFMGVREYPITAPILCKYMPIRRGGPYPRGFSVNPRQKSL